MKTFRYTLFLGLFLFIALLSPSVLAVGKPDTVGSRPERKQKAQNRLADAKLKACQTRENAIKKRIEQLTKLATTMQEKFDAIAQRVEKYYTTKVVPGGKTVANYDNLVADIQTKKTAVQTALAQTQANATNFSCTGSDPKGQMTQFRDDMRGVKKALQDYRTSIKNLIVAVHSKNE